MLLFDVGRARFDWRTWDMHMVVVVVVMMVMCVCVCVSVCQCVTWNAEWVHAAEVQ